MSTAQTWQTESTSSDNTEAIAERLGRALKGGEVIELVSDLGGGKTTFVRGLTRGADSTDKVASPTFTISKVYDCPKFKIHHFDFYRLNEPGIIADELAELLGDPQVVIVIEWADVVHHVLPGDRLSVTIQQTPNGDRTLTFQSTEQFAYLLDALK